MVSGDDTVLAGNGVYEQAQEMGIPVRIVETDGRELIAVKRTDLTGAKARQAAALDNIVADTSAYDYDAERLAELVKDDAVIAALAQEDARLSELLRGEAKPEPKDAGELVDKAAELQAKWQVQRGDVWTIGRHRLMCGDSTNAEDVAKLMQGERADLLLADPPYGKLKIFNPEGKVGNIGNDPKYQLAKMRTYGAYANEGTFDLRLLLNALNGAYEHSIIWGGNYFTDVLPISSAWLVWDKRSSDEPILFFADCELAWSDLGTTARVFSHVWQGMIRQGEDRDRAHPTQKPIELYDWCLGLPTAKDAKIVLDPTLGSGSSLVACERVKRIGIGMEIEPKYCAVSLERLAGLGLTPQRIGNAE